MRNLSNSPNGIKRLLVFVLILVVLCTGISYFTASLVMKQNEWRHDQPHGHQWLKNELGLTDAEGARIDAYEADYRLKRKELQAEFNSRVAALGLLIRSNQANTPEVKHAVHQLHEVHGQLQELSIEHYYDMLNVLPPDKQEKLRNLAVEALSQPE